MFGLRSARGRAIFAGLVLTFLLVVVTALTVWRIQEQNHALSELEHTSTAATALEHARAQLYLQTSLLSGLAFSQDPDLIDQYHQAQSALEEDLSVARAEAVAGGDAEQVAILDDLATRKAQFDAMVNLAIPRVLEMDASEATQMTANYLPTVWDTVDTIFEDIDRLAEDERQDFAADRAAAAQDADLNLWLVIARSAVALVLTAALAVVVIQSILRPLASVRLSARAIASGNLNARAKEFGPEEVASLARDFNRMTDALAAKTEEYITTTNLTGDIIGRVDAHGKWTFLNDAAWQFLGKPRERLLGTDALATMHPDDLEATEEAVREARASKEPKMGLVNRMITPTGTRVVEWNAHPLFDKEGQYTGTQITGRDITERKRVEEALRDSEARYRLLAENTTDLIWTMDLSLRYTYMSPAITRMRGYSVEEIVGTTVQETMTPASLEVARNALAEELALERTGQADPLRSRKLELEMYCKDGSAIWTEMNMTFLRDTDGRPIGILGVTRDISERKRAEQALSARMEEYVATTNLTGDVMGKIDHEGRWTFLNDAACQFLGKPREELLGTDARASVHPEDLESTVQAVLEARDGKQPIKGFVNRQITPLGIRVVEWNACPLFDEHGQYAGIQMTGRDITEHNQAEEALRNSEEKYRDLVENMNEVVYALDTNGVVTYVSPVVEQLGGYTPAEIVGRSFTEFIHPDDLLPLMQSFQRTVSGDLEPFEFRILSKSGEAHWVRTSSRLVLEGERVVGLQAVLMDITDRKQAEDELRQAEERYRELFEEAPAMYLICRDQDGVPTIADCNQLFLSTVGYTRDEVAGRPMADFYTPESRAQLLEGRGFQRALAGQFVAEERQLLTKDGRIVETVLRAVPEIGPDGHALGTRAMYLDISERKRSEEALEESERRYRLLADNATDLIWTTDMSLRYTYISPSVLRLRGYTVEEAMAHTVEQDLCPSSLDLAMRVLAEEVAREGSEEKAPYRWRTLELEHFCKDGSTVWLEVTVTFLRGEDGRPAGLLGSSRDITERKGAEQALRESEEKYRRLVQDATDGIAIVEGLELKFVNRALLGMYGGESEDEMVGRPLTDFVAPEDRELMVERSRARERGQDAPDHYEFKALRKDGTRFDAELSVSLITYEGRVARQGVIRDITERKRAEEALRTKDSAIASSINAIALADMEGGLTYVNPSLLKMWGYDDEEEVLGRNVSEFWQEKEKALEVGKALRDEGSWAGELVAIRRDGSPFHVDMVASTVTDEAGNPICVMGSFLDITERKQMEGVLRESEARYRLLAENTSDLIWTMDLSLRYTYMSPAITRMRGYSVEEIVGTTIQETMTPASLEAARTALAEELALERTGQSDPLRSRKIELEMYCKDRSTIWTEMNTTFLRDADGRPIGILGVTRDISERKRSEEALEESERRYRLLADNASDIIWTMDMNLRYTYESPSVTRTRGYTPAEAMAQTIEETLTPASVVVARKALAEELAPQAINEKDPSRSLTLELEHTCKDGSTVWLEVTTTFLRDSDGNPIGLLGISRDISERKRAEEERKRLHAELETRAVTDSLTGLYNHAYFYERLADEIDRSRRYGHNFALVMMDVDAFKHYNDSRGHQAGDAALRLVGECVRSAMRRSDLAFRYGGDEFVTILLNADVSKAQGVVRRINKRIAARLKEAGDSAEAWLGVSAGIACYPADATTVDDLVGMADGAMYDAKRLAWARGVMGQRKAADSVVCPVSTLHETQTRMLSGAANSLSAALQDLTAPQSLSETDLRTLAALGAAAEIKDPFIRGHQERTSRLAATVAKEMGLSPDRVRNITTAGLLHDLGKVSVRESILNKPGKLTESEFAKMKEHASLGATMIVSGAEALQPVAPIVRHHHERVDGNGYPDGLARENIPLEARILSVADAFDAMTHERSYRKALSTEEALGEIQRGAGTRFDHAVVEAFLGVVRRRGGETG